MTPFQLDVLAQSPVHQHDSGLGSSGVRGHAGAPGARGRRVGGASQTAGEQQPVDGQDTTTREGVGLAQK